MQFGTQLLPGIGVLFRLYAPGARTVDLVLSSPQYCLLPMEKRSGGWFSVQHPTASEGDLYQFRIDENTLVPDPASRYQAEDVHGPSVVCDPDGFCWQDGDWRGHPWEEAVIYELHVGTFTPEGTFSGVMKRLDYLVELGVTAIELMPLAQFPGRRNWGYDGALLFAPCNMYGTTEDLKLLIQTAHEKGIMVFLDVVYNHFSPEGNYLYVYAKDAFFTEKFQTPWGAAINFSGNESQTVRDFFVANALYWLEEYHFDGLRFDAVHAIYDESSPTILEQIAQAVYKGPGQNRYIHLILENDHNCARYLERTQEGQPRNFVAQWNDDIHHTCHTLLTGEGDGYYADYTQEPIRHLGRCLTEGFAYQGEISGYRKGVSRGEPSAHLPLTAFVSFLQNHDQIGNRAFGERLHCLCDPVDLLLVQAVVLLAPSVPLLFMGEEFGAATPFYFFCNFGPELVASVTEGRRREFARFAKFRTEQTQKQIPDPNAEETFFRSKLDWESISSQDHQKVLEHHQELLKIRHQHIVPRLKGLAGGKAGFRVHGPKALTAWWVLDDGSELRVQLNLGDHDISDGSIKTERTTLYQFPSDRKIKAGTRKTIVWKLGGRC